MNAEVQYQPRCAHCGGTFWLQDGEEVCMTCSRPRHPPTPVPYVNGSHGEQHPIGRRDNPGPRTKRGERI